MGLHFLRSNVVRAILLASSATCLFRAQHAWAVGYHHARTIVNFDGDYNNSIQGVAADSFGNVWVSVDGGSPRIEEYGGGGAFIRSVDLGEEWRPWAITVDPFNAVWVGEHNADAFYPYRGQRFSNNGILLQTIDGSNIPTNQQLLNPLDVAVRTNMYVLDENRVIKLDPSTGDFLGSIGSAGTGNGELHYPAGIGVNLTGDVWIADTFNYRIQRFSPSGAFLQSIGSHGNGNGQFIDPVDVAVDSWGNIWVVDITSAEGAQFDRIQEFNSSGTFIRAINGLYGIFHLAVDNFGNVFATEENRVEEFSPTFVLGDLDGDDHVDAHDINAMTNAIVDLAGYKLATGLDDAALLKIADLNGDFKITNADLQKLLNLLISGGGSANAVPEPGGMLLALTSAMILIAVRLRGPRTT